MKKIVLLAAQVAWANNAFNKIIQRQRIITTYNEDNTPILEQTNT